MLLTVQSVRPAPVFSKIDKATILSSFKPAAQSEYVLSDDERTLTKIGPADSSSRSFEVTGKPRPGAKCFMRVKVNGSSYSVIVISPELITATNHVVDYRLASCERVDRRKSGARIRPDVQVHRRWHGSIHWHSAAHGILRTFGSHPNLRGHRTTRESAARRVRVAVRSRNDCRLSV